MTLGSKNGSNILFSFWKQGRYWLDQQEWKKPLIETFVTFLWFDQSHVQQNVLRRKFFYLPKKSGQEMAADVNLSQQLWNRYSFAWQEIMAMNTGNCT